jgi:Tol biopolymer transport system component
MGCRRVAGLLVVLVVAGVGAIASPRRADATTVPVMSVQDVAITEGDIGSTTVRVPVVLSEPSATTVAARFTVSSTDASSTRFKVASGSLSFAIGVIEKYVPVTIYGDTVVEPTAHVLVNITSVTNATFSGTPGVVTIADNDANGVSATPEVNVGDVTTVQGLLGTQQVYVPITLSRPSTVALKLAVSTSCGSASDEDFGMRTLTVSVPIGKLVVLVPLAVYPSTDPPPSVTFKVQATIETASFTPVDMSGDVTIDGGSATPPDNNLPIGISRIDEPSGGGDPLYLTSTCGNIASGATTPLGAISRNGQVAVFSSAAVNLVPVDTNGLQDIFARDLITGGTERISVAPDGTDANGYSFGPTVSSDGRYVMFESGATNIVPDGFQDSYSGYVYDRVTHTTVRLGNGDPTIYGVSRSATMSNDDRYIAFEGNTSPGDNSIYLQDRAAGTTTRVADGWMPVISGDGNTIVYLTIADDVMALDVASGTTEQLSIDPSGTAMPGADVYNLDPLSISTDGRYVTFTAALTQGHFEVYLRDRQAETTELETVTPDGNPANSGFHGSVSDDGRYVAFQASDAAFNTDWSPPLDGECDCGEIYERDRQTGITVHVSQTPEGDRPNNDSMLPTVSADGRYVAFTSDATDLIANDTDLNPNFLIDRLW